MTTIYLVRHAHSVYSPDEYHRGLSDRGKRDAEKITAALVRRDIDLVLSSPYQRAIDTIKGVANTKNVAIELDARFRERTLSSTPVDNFDSAVKAVWADPNFSHPGGESNHEARVRGIMAIEEILEKHHDRKEIVIGTHGNMMTLIMQHYDPRYNYHFWENELGMPDIYGLEFENKQCIEIFHVPF